MAYCDLLASNMIIGELVCDRCDGIAPEASPSLPRRAANLARAICGHVANGLQAASEATQKRRLAKCRKCRYSPTGALCIHPDCGCVLRFKVTWASESCPIGKWPAEGQGGVAPNAQAQQPTEPQRREGGCRGCGKGR